MSYVRLPSDNKLVDGEGRFLPQWRGIFEAASRLSALTSQQQETLIALINAMTSGDNPVTLNADGTISVDQQQISATSSISAYNFGAFVATQAGVDGAIPLNAKRSALFSPNADNAGLVISGVDASFAHPVTGVMYGPTAACSDAGVNVSLVANRIYAAHFSIPAPVTITKAGALCSGAIFNTVNTAIYADNGGRPGKQLAIVSPGGGTPGLLSGNTFSLSIGQGNYWVLMQPTNATSNFRGVNTGGFGGRTGYIQGAGIDLRAVTGMFRDPGSNMLDDETASTWTETYNGGNVMPLMMMGA